MYKNGIIKWAEQDFNEQLKDCFKQYDDETLTIDSDESFSGGFWDLAYEMHSENPSAIEHESVFLLLVDYYERVKYNKEDNNEV